MRLSGIFAARLTMTNKSIYKQMVASSITPIVYPHTWHQPSVLSLYPIYPTPMGVALK